MAKGPKNKNKNKNKKASGPAEETPRASDGVIDPFAAEGREGNTELKPNSEQQSSEPKEPTNDDEPDAGAGPIEPAEGGLGSEGTLGDGIDPANANGADSWDDRYLSTQPVDGEEANGEADYLQGESETKGNEEPPAVEYLHEEPAVTPEVPIVDLQATAALSPLDGEFSGFQDAGSSAVHLGTPVIEFLGDEPDEPPSPVQSFVAEPTQSSETPITWYCSGTQVTESLGEKIDSSARSNIQNSLPDYTPTTWEEWEAYLSEREASKEGDLRRVMCYFSILKIFGQGSVQLISEFAEHRHPIDLQEGDSMIIPAVDLPPAVFKRDYRRRKTKTKSVIRQPLMNEVHIEGKMQVLAIMSYWVRQDQ
ncbi:hypothetical protein NEOLEDRAFT_575932 [Neolentinus lepideus HHB14362 ss-1]|uniref:Uncharacterized protein n=1 Tax=Neolentinus lepideus HHB14362 ss-1 TaxID=1314782 RepID=A0A165QXB7_9AGAM|nr:hypothetical protein NEOLEDRAFT_575932 [Neolentinus lepideus HHB14362 ss-1]